MLTRELAVSYHTVEELKPYAANARTHSKAQVQAIANSMKVFGWTNPILIDGRKGIIAGHGRLAAALKLKLKRVPTIELTGLSEAQRRAYLIADNQLATQASWDLQLLSTELTALQGGGFNLDLLGFSPAELKGLVGPDAPTRKGKIPDDEIAPVGPPVSRRGDTWTLGRHRVLCGDATESKDLARLLGNDSPDIMWTDPPYNVDYQAKAGKISNDAMAPEDFYTLLLQAFSNAYLRLRAGAVVYVAHADTARVAFTQSFVESGFKLAQVLIWVKHSAVLSRQDYNWQHEPILYGWKEGGPHYFCGDFSKTTVIDDDLDLAKLPRAELEAMVKSLTRTRTTVVRQDRPSKSEMHPTMKPVALVQELLAASALEGQLVLDVFGGSGSTLIAAEKLGMNARLLELEPRYVDVIVRRWEAFTGLKASNTATGKPFDKRKTPAHKSKKR